MKENKIDRTLLIECPTKSDADKVFHYLLSQGEVTYPSKYGYTGINWRFIGWRKAENCWTVAQNNSEVGDNIISAAEFLKEEENLIGRWVKALRDFSDDFPVGTYDVIIQDDEDCSCVILENYRSCDRERLVDGDIELMPIGWTPKDDSMKAIQEECKKRFPIGCEFRNTTRNKLILTEDNVTYSIHDKCIYAHIGGGCLYDDGKWAELISLPEPSLEDLLKEAPSRFPIGSVFSNVNLGINCENIEVTGNNFYVWDDEIMINQDSCKGDMVGSNYTVYKDGKWAEITSNSETKEELPEYVECITNKFNAIHKGKIYKLSSDSHGEYYYLIGITSGSYSPEFFKPSTKEAYDAQNSFTKESKLSPLEICRQKYRKGMKVKISTSFKTYEFVITVDPKDFRERNNDVDYFGSPSFLYFNGKYAEILEEGVFDYSEVYKETEGSKWLKEHPLTENKPLIENVQSISVSLHKKTSNNKFKF